jgi:oxygen-independent coproporphyrinogen-3 oxidase
VDTIFFGGGTPSLLSAQQMHRLFTALRNHFDVSKDAEITLECAPGQLSDPTLDELLQQGMNRVSFGVQSFVDREAAAVGRLHTREMCLAEIARLRSVEVSNLNVDLIVGLPRQTAASCRESIEIALASGVPHLSLYMLEVDEESRLGREMLAHGTRYSAADVPTEDETAEWYAAACEALEAAGVQQYEISNFARSVRSVEGCRDNPETAHSEPSHCKADLRSRHNRKYWLRDPYLGFGLDAHSMLRKARQAGLSPAIDAVRWANADDLDAYLTDQIQPEPSRVRAQSPTPTDLFRLHTATAPKIELAAPSVESISREQAFEESIFLGLRLNEGIDLNTLQSQFGERLMQDAIASLGEIEQAGLLLREANRVRLTARGRMASNEVFSRLLLTKPPVALANRRER